MKTEFIIYKQNQHAWDDKEQWFTYLDSNKQWNNRMSLAKRFDEYTEAKEFLSTLHSFDLVFIQTVFSK